MKNDGFLGGLVTYFGLSFWNMGRYYLVTRVDGAGVIQTPEIKSISLIVILIAFIIPVFFQVIWLIINLRMSRKIIIRFSFSINNKREESTSK